MSLFRIFIIEDDETTAFMLRHHLNLNPDSEVEVFHSGKDCIANLHKQPDVICLDYYLPGENGDEIIRRLLNYKSDLPIIVVSGQQEVSKALELLKKGIYDYVVKDENTKDRLWKIVNNIKSETKLKKRINVLEGELKSRYSFSDTIIGESKAIKGIFPLIEKAASSNLVVSVTGDTGTGKELVAKAIHYNSERKKQAFVAINVAAIPDNLIESELFGHEKGAFTGAGSKKIGKFEEANNGTLLLDEIGDMNLFMQSKLLRVLQEQELTRLGGNQLIKLNVRLIVSTNKDLRGAVEQGSFREDLFYRLMGISINLKPLRERENDIIILAKFFVMEYCKKNKIPIKTFTKDALTKLLSHTYPGNVRELKAISELAVVMADSKTITADCIQINFTGIQHELLAEEMSLDEYNQLIIKHYLDKYSNKVREVSKILGIGKSTIYRMIKNNQ